MFLGAWENTFTAWGRQDQGGTVTILLVFLNVTVLGTIPDPVFRVLDWSERTLGIVGLEDDLGDRKVVFEWAQVSGR